MIVISTQVSLELLRSVLSKESALSDLDCVDKLLGMISPILRDPPAQRDGGGGDADSAMQVVGEEIASACTCCSTQRS